MKETSKSVRSSVHAHVKQLPVIQSQTVLPKSRTRTGLKIGRDSDIVLRRKRLSTLWKPVQFLCLSLFLSSYLLGLQVGSQAPDKDVDRYTWDLASLYPQEKDWQAERALVLEQVKSVRKLRGTMSASPRALERGLNKVSELRARSTKMAIYASLMSDFDSTSDIAASHDAVASALETQVESSVAFVPDEIKKVGAARLQLWLRTQPGLAKHRTRILRILREAPHTLVPEQEALLSSMAIWPRESADAFWAIHDSDISWADPENCCRKRDRGQYLFL